MITTLTKLPASAVPDTVGVVLLVVCEVTTGALGAVVSGADSSTSKIVTVMFCERTLPTASVAVNVIV